jgi:hypothetical protein
MTRPVNVIWTGHAFEPCGDHHLRIAAADYEDSRLYRLAPVEDRSDVTHNHQFAWIGEAWNSLPERYAGEAWAATPETLRKYALIRTGYCSTEIFTCGSKAEAQRWAANLRGLRDEFAIIIPKESTVQVFTAKSQKKRAMGAKEFQESKQAILDFIADLIGVEPATLNAQEKAA